MEKTEENTLTNPEEDIQNLSDATMEEQIMENSESNAVNKNDGDEIDVVALPFIMDGETGIQVFQNSMFRKTETEDAIKVAERYFFEKFDCDDEPKWDGVMACLYNLTKREIIKDDRNGFINLRDFKSRWLSGLPGSMDNVTFNIKCTMPKVLASHFQSFLIEMEKFGKNGHSGKLSFMTNGLESFKPVFKFSREYDRVPGLKQNTTDSNSELLFGVR